MDRRTLLTALPALAGCNASLSVFDTVAPRDGGVRRLAHDARYGAGPRRTLDVYAPADARARLPVIMFIYGGSWRHGDKDDYSFAAAALASRGFVVAIPDYRLVPEVRFPGFLEDCASALGWIQDNGAALGCDIARIVLAGHSAGAYNAVMLALDRTYLDAAGVPPNAIRGAVGLAGPYDFLPFDVDATRNAFGQAPEPSTTQPIHYARADGPPLLLLWGEADDVVGPRNIEGLERAVRTAGGAVETKTYPGVDHVEIMLALSRPFRGRAPVLEDVTAFASRVTT